MTGQSSHLVLNYLLLLSQITKQNIKTTVNSKAKRMKKIIILVIMPYHNSKEKIAKANIKKTRSAARC